MVDICREGRRQRSAPQKRHTAHLRRRTHCTPRKPSGRDRGGDKLQPSTGGVCAHQAPGHLSCLDLGRAQNTGSTKSSPLWSIREPEWLRLEKGMQPRPTSNSSQQRNLEPEQCRLGKHTCCEWGQTQCGRYTVSPPHTGQWYTFAGLLPPHNRTEQVSLKCDHHRPLVSRWKLDTEEASKPKKLK